MIGFIIFLGWYVMDKGGIDYSLSTKEEKIFKTYIKDTVPEGISDIKADLKEEVGYTLYISFISTEEFTNSLIEKYQYGKVDCSLVERQFSDNPEGSINGDFYITDISPKNCYSSYGYIKEGYDNVNSYMVTSDSKVYMKEYSY